MINNLRKQGQGETGFTLIELLVVILIIGILAAIALPAFLGQRAKGQDSSAKSDARNIVSELESCFATTQNYAGCSTAVADAGLAAGDVSIGTLSATGYVITAASGSGNNFVITKNPTTGVVTRSCNTSGNAKKSAGTAKGGCSGSSW